MRPKPNQMKADRAAVRAEKTLKHYFRLLFEAAGLGWDDDNDTEIEWIIHNLIEAAINQERLK